MSLITEKLKAKMSGPKDLSPHLMVIARAGTGKTTTLVEGLKILKGIEPKIKPSYQQQEIWDSISLSKGLVNSVCFAAFNNTIADELKRRVPKGVEAMTIHSMGLKAIRKYYPSVIVDNENKRVKSIFCQVVGKDIWEIRRDPYLNARMYLACNLVSKFKITLTDYTGSDVADKILELAMTFGIELEDEDLGSLASIVVKMLDLSKDIAADNTIDFNDMPWIPLIHNLPVFKYDLLMIDEAQDLSRCQQELVMKAGKRLIICGDPRQAIYQFAGADSGGMNRMCGLLDFHREVVALPLTITRRCSKAVVREAQKYVKDIEAASDAPEGEVSYLAHKDTPHNMVPCYLTKVKAGDMILSRTNAPLIKECYRLFRQKRKAFIQGKNIESSLISLINKMRANDIPSLISALDNWLHAEISKEQAKRFPNEDWIETQVDRVSCIRVFTERETTIAGVITKITETFTDDKESPGIRLASIHKAKGMEAERVFLLLPDDVRIENEEEQNLMYVAITRAKLNFYYVPIRKENR